MDPIGEPAAPGLEPAPPVHPNSPESLPANRRLAWSYPRFGRLAAAVWVRNFLAWSKAYRSSVLLNFGEPVMNLLALGLGLGAYVTGIGQVSFLEFIAPGLLAVTAMNAVTFDMGFEGFDRLRTTGVYDAMATSPLEIEEIVGGELLWEASRSVMYGAIFLLVLALFGLVHSWWVLLLPVVLVLSGFVFASAALAVVSVARVHEHLFFYFTLVITPMFMFSGVFFPVDRMPEVLQWIVKALPLYHVVELCRALVLGIPSHTGIGGHLTVLAGFAAVTMALPVPMLRKALTN